MVLLWRNRLCLDAMIEPAIIVSLSLTKSVCMTSLRQRLIEDICLRNFSSRTVEAYVPAVAHLARHYGRSPEQISGEQVRQYLLYMVQERRVSSSSLTNRHEACRAGFFFPVRVLSRVFRGRFIDGIKQARARGKLHGAEAPQQFDRLLEAAVKHAPRVIVRMSRPGATRLSGCARAVIG